MGSHGHDSTTRTLAAAFREVLEEAQWEPDQGFELVTATLQGMSDGVTKLVTEDNALTAFETWPLGDIHVFVAAVHKTINQQHPAQSPGRRAMPRAGFADEVRQQFPSFHRTQRELLEALDQAFPCP